MMVGSKDQKVSVDRGRSEDTMEGPNSEAYIQHFQEEFLRLFYEDPDFREQVLKCLLTGENDEGTGEARKPRRTWFNGIGETQEISSEEARYLHHCGENTSAESDLSSEAADERCDGALRTNVATHEQPRKIGSDEMQMAGSLAPMTESFFPSEMFGTKDGDTGGHDSVEDRPQAPFSLADATQGKHKTVEESSTGPCVHERGTQTWKANPLYLLGNSDSDSNDSWQQEGSNVAWMDELEKGRMLQEVKMRRMKRWEEPRPSLKAQGYHSCSEHSKSDQDERYFSSNIQGLRQYCTDDIEAAHLQGKENMNADLARNLSIGSLCLPSPSFICLMPEQKDGKALKSFPEQNSRENLRSPEDNSTNFPFAGEYRDPDTSSVGANGDENGDLTLAIASAEARRFDQDLFSNPPHSKVSQDLPLVFLQEDERALLQQPFPKISLLKNTLDSETSPSPGLISGTQDFDINENENPKTSLEVTSLPEKRWKLEDELIAPISNIFSPPLPVEMNGNEDDTQSSASTCPAQITNSDVQLVSLSEKISLPPNCDEVKSPTKCIQGSTKILKEDLSISQGLPPSVCSILSREHEQLVSGNLSQNERNKRVQGEIGLCNMHTQTRFDEEERPSLVTPPQASTCRGTIGKETTTSVTICGDMFGEKEIPSPLSPRIWKESRLEAIDEQEQQVDPPKTIICESVYRPMAIRAPFKPARDIHWLPPKRTIHLMGIQTPSAHIKFDIEWNRPQAKAHMIAHEGEFIKEDKMKKDSSRSQLKRIELWASLLRKLFKRTIMMRWEFNRKKSDQEICS